MLCGLVDIHQHRFHSKIPSHRKGSGKIDFMLGSPAIVNSVTRAGILSLDDAFCSDHRLMYIDIDILTFFKGISSNPAHPQQRSFTTKNKKRTTVFRQAVASKWTQRKISSRVSVLSRLSHLPSQILQRPRLLEMWNKVDREVGEIFQEAELALKTPTQRKLWSPALASAGAEKRYWKTRLAHAQRGTSYGVKILRKRRELNITDDLTNDIAELQRRHDNATKKYEHAAAQDDHLRAEHLQDMIQSQEKSSSTLTALKSLAKSEAQKKMFTRIKATFKSLRPGSVSRVDVPVDITPHLDLQNPDNNHISTDNEDLKDILARTIRTKRQDGLEEWTTIIFGISMPSDCSSR